MARLFRAFPVWKRHQPPVIGAAVVAAPPVGKAYIYLSHPRPHVVLASGFHRIPVVGAAVVSTRRRFAAVI